MRILALDVATDTGWAFYDTDKHVSAIECGVISLIALAGRDAAKRREKRVQIDYETTLLHNRFRPDATVIEAPLDYIKTGDGRRGQRAPLLPVEATDKPSGGPNAHTVILLNQLFAAAETVARHKSGMVIEVRAQTWQSILPKTDGDTKTRSLRFCHAMRISLPEKGNKEYRANAADASAIAIWAAGHCQEIKLAQKARAA